MNKHTNKTRNKILTFLLSMMSKFVKKFLTSTKNINFDPASLFNSNKIFKSGRIMTMLNVSKITFTKAQNTKT